jgi:hypothetical protein
MERIETIKNKLYEIDSRDFLKVFNNCFEDKAVFRMEEFNEECKGETPLDLLELVEGGNFHTNDNYFTFDWGGYLISSDNLKDLVEDDYVEEVAEELLKGEIKCDNREINYLIESFKLQDKYGIK